MGRLHVMLLISAAAAAGGCGGSRSSATDLDVAAASSLKTALVEASPAFSKARVRLSFAGSDKLAAQIRAGARPDVYAAANSDLPRALAAEGLVERPVTFARNELVLAVPREGGRVSSLTDLGTDGVRIAVGAPSVPIGAYTRTLLGRLAGPERARVVANIGSQEPDVAGVIGKLAQGAVDAGFVYRTDVRATAGRVRAITLPQRLRPWVVYAAAVVAGSDRAPAARAYVRALRAGAAATALKRAGFLPAP